MPVTNHEVRPRRLGCVAMGSPHSARRESSPTSRLHSEPKFVSCWPRSPPPLKPQTPLRKRNDKSLSRPENASLSTGNRSPFSQKLARADRPVIFYDGSMVVSSCPGCLERDVRIAELERQLAELQRLFLEQKQHVANLEARLNINSSNSSMPPSSDPPRVPKTKKKKRSGRKRGGQPGHPPHLKQLLPPERVTRVVTILPKECSDCKARLPANPGPNDTEIKRFQTIEQPPVLVEVVEYQAHTRTCPCCDKVNQAVIPADIRKHSIGPRLTGTLSYLTGNLGLSKRNVEGIVEDLFGAPISLGTVSNLEREVSAALETPHREALEAVRQAQVAFADETSWKLWGKLCWLWAVATASIAAFVIHPKRSALGFAAILGTRFDGLLHSDRYHVYRQIAPEKRQICWAHLKRDFKKVLDRGGTSGFVGRRGCLASIESGKTLRSG